MKDEDQSDVLALDSLYREFSNIYWSIRCQLIVLDPAIKHKNSLEDLIAIMDQSMDNADSLINHLKSRSAIDVSRYINSVLLRLSRIEDEIFGLKALFIDNPIPYTASPANRSL